MAKRLRGAAACVAASALLLGGCATHGVLGASVMPAEEATLGEAVLAFYVSPQVPIPSNRHGFVTLVDLDGSVRTVRTSGMDVGQLSWTEKGLFFADGFHDYLLTEIGMEVIPSVKSDYQVSMFTVGDRFVGVYNDRFTEIGYQDNVVVTENGRSTRIDVEGMYGTVGNCDGRIVGTAEASGLWAKEYARYAPSPNPTNLLVELYPRTGTVIGPLRTVPYEAESITPDVPCVDDTMVMVHEIPVGPEQELRPIIRSWNTRTAQITDWDLLDAHGRKLALNPDDPAMSQMDSGSLVEGRLRWLSSRGQVMSTDPATGITRELFTVQGISDGVDQAESVFAPDAVFVLDIRHRDHSQDLVLRRYDIPGGQETEVVRIEGVNELLARGNTDLNLRGIAINPEILGRS